ncbi:O-antigen polysaccharide polymerase Wzy, partial [Salmonella enterica]|nr:O-antigen polysaccharide polymerase Wzy [Salmonella enterica subsp. enterica serovar Senftenberg]EBD2196358.1 O-antigen polysaccharide polymerase Wzy [Salmonella enterica]
MVFLAWFIAIGIYIICGILYLQFPQLSPLGALAYTDTVGDVIMVVSTGVVGVFLG